MTTQTIPRHEEDADLPGGLLNWFLYSSLESSSGKSSIPPWDPRFIDLDQEQRDILLAIWAYAYAAAHKTPGLRRNVRLMELFLEIPPAFPDFLAERLTTVLAERGTTLSGHNIIHDPPGWLEEAIEDAVCAFIREEPLRRLSGLRSELFEHTDDRLFLDVIRRAPGAGKLVAMISDKLGRSSLVQLMVSAVAVTHDSMPDLYRTYRETCEVLDVTEPPELYVEFGMPNARTVGGDKAVIVITSAAASLFNKRELAFVFGHELGHILAGHVRYHTLANSLSGSGGGVAARSTGVIRGAVARCMLGPTLFSWYRRAEITADRAGYLACQNRESALSVMMKLAGFPPIYYRHLNTEDLLHQYQTYRDAVENNVFDRVSDVFRTASCSHPFAVQRAWELSDWIGRGCPDGILRSSAVELSECANCLSRDLREGELRQRVSESLACWCECELKCLPKHARILSREVINQLGCLDDTPLRAIKRVELVALRESASSIRYDVDVLLMTTGRFERVRIPVEYSSAWDQSPASVRHAFVNTSLPEISHRIYPAESKILSDWKSRGDLS